MNKDSPPIFFKKIQTRNNLLWFQILLLLLVVWPLPTHAFDSSSMLASTGEVITSLWCDVKNWFGGSCAPEVTEVPVTPVNVVTVPVPTVDTTTVTERTEPVVLSPQSTYVTNEYVTNPTTVVREVVQETVRTEGGGGNTIDTSNFVTRALFDAQVNGTNRSIEDNLSNLSEDLAEAISTGALSVSGNSTLESLTVTNGTTLGGSLTLAALGGGVLVTDASGVVSTSTISASSIADDSLDFAQLSDAMVVDATTSFDLDTNNADLNFDNGTLFIDPVNNRIGIGTTNPQQTLSVMGNAEFYNDNAADAYNSVGINAKATSGYGGTDLTFRINDGSSTTNLYGFGAEVNDITDLSTRDFWIYDSVADKYRMALNGAGDWGIGGNINPASLSGSSMVVKSSGNVGIGTSTPQWFGQSSSRLLAIAGATVPGVAITETSAGGHQYMLYSGSGGGGGTHGFGIYDSTRGADSLTVMSDGDLYINGSVTTCILGDGSSATNCSASDRRLKENIVSLKEEAGLETVGKLNPVTFTWNAWMQEHGSVATTQYGLIAQDVQKVLPELVQDGGKGYYTLNYQGLFAPIIKSIQELDVRTQVFTALIEGSATSSTFSLSTADSDSFWSQLRELVSSFVDGVLHLPEAFVVYLRADVVETKELCVLNGEGKNVCLTGDQLQDLLEVNDIKTIDAAADEIENYRPSSSDDAGDGTEDNDFNTATSDAVSEETSSETGSIVSTISTVEENMEINEADEADSVEGSAETEEKNQLEGLANETPTQENENEEVGSESGEVVSDEQADTQSE